MGPGPPTPRSLIRPALPGSSDVTWIAPTIGPADRGLCLVGRGPPYAGAHPTRYSPSSACQMGSDNRP